MNNSPSKAWHEPESAQTKYPYNHVISTDSGHSFEMHDTKGAEKIRLSHRNGTFFEMNANGDFILRSDVGNGYEIINDGNKNISINGDCNLYVAGDCSTNVGGNYYLNIDGDYIENISGNIIKMSNDDSKQNMNTTEGDHNVNTTGDIVLSTGTDGKVIINGDMVVNGDILSQQTVFAQGNITTMADVLAMGSLRTPGNLLVGTPYVYTKMPVPQAGSSALNVVMINTTGETLMNSLTGTTITSVAAIKAIAGAAISLKAGAAFTATAGAMATIKSAGTTSITAPTTNISGVTSVGGILSVSGIATAAEFINNAGNTIAAAMVNPPTSDYRLKNVNGPLQDSGAFIDSLNPLEGTWKEDGSKFVGFLAHEYQEVLPNAVYGEKDAVDENGNPVYQRMSASSNEMIAYLVAEIQSLRTRLAKLES